MLNRTSDRQVHVLVLQPSGLIQRKVDKYNFLRDTHIFVPLACEITGVWCAEGAEFLNELGRRTSIITGDKHEMATCFNDCPWQYRGGTQLVSIIVFLIWITSVNNTPPSAIPAI